MNTKPFNPSSMIAGAILIVLGLVFFITSQSALAIDWGVIWPVFPMLLGLGLLSMAILSDTAEHRPPLAVWGTIPVLLGLFFFATTLHVGITWTDQATLWGLYPAILGAALLAGYMASGFRRHAYLISGAILTVAGLGLVVLTREGILYPFVVDTLARLGSEAALAWLDFANTWWPVAVIALGAILFGLSFSNGLRSARAASTLFGTMFLLLGAFFLLTTLDVLAWADQGRLWPIYPMIVGVAMLVSYVASNRAQARR